MVNRPARNHDSEKLAKEAKRWSILKHIPDEWVDAPEAIPQQAMQQISLAIPKQLFLILDEFAVRKGISCQALIKQWLDDRIRTERLIIRDTK